MLVGEFEVDDVETRLGGSVAHVQRAVFVIVAFDFGLGRAFDRQGKTAVAGVLRVDVEVVVLLRFSLGQGVARDFDLAGVSDVAGGYADFERGVFDVFSIAFHRHQVLSRFSGCEREASVAAGQLLEETRLLHSLRGDDVSVEGSKVGLRQRIRELDIRAGPHGNSITLFAFASDLAGEGRTFDVIVGELGGDLVLAWCSGKIRDVDRSIFVVVAIDFCL